MVETSELTRQERHWPKYTSQSPLPINKNIKNGLTYSTQASPNIWERNPNLLKYQLDVSILQARTLDFSQGLVHCVLLVNGVN